MSRVAYSFAAEHGAFLERAADNDDVFLIVYRPDASLLALQELQRLGSARVRFEALNTAAFNDRLADAYQNDSQSASLEVEQHLDLDALIENVPITEDLLAQEDDAPIIRLINALFSDAVEQNASDIHIETFEQRVQVRFRTDGIMRDIVQPPRALAQLLVSRIKIMAQLDIAEKRVPQDGRIGIKLGGRDIDVRVSTLPTRHGERVVMRLLDRGAMNNSLAQFELTTEQEQAILGALSSPNGIVLVSGPTGSGKTTTLYAALSHLNDGQRTILTVEDPVEYDLEGVGQTQVNTKVEMSFARGLRAILRQDPDVVMIGEIRDKETADIAIQASLTGHLVLSTLHTNTALGTVARLMDMGVEPFLLASSLNAVIAQRLVRTLCPHCRQLSTAPAEILQAQGYDGTHYEACGCDQCYDQGYKGRRGIYEVIGVDETLKRMIHQQAAEAQLVAYVRERQSLIFHDGLRLVNDGITTLTEVMRVCSA